MASIPGWACRPFRGVSLLSLSLSLSLFSSQCRVAPDACQLVANSVCQGRPYPILSLSHTTAPLTSRYLPGLGNGPRQQRKPMHARAGDGEVQRGRGGPAHCSSGTGSWNLRASHRIASHRIARRVARVCVCHKRAA
ncbi:hypothetical protein GGR56DRAFT_28418 [Xylariaceae sp. FL0804]|nr:hypothetical protein GGR56DRAFT_28418 [Xylariaceae sp. FL0804]